MADKRLLLLGFSVWLIVTIVVANQASRLDFGAHDAALRAFARLRSVDGGLQRDALAARYGLLDHYDPLVLGSARLAAAARVVNTAAKQTVPQATAEITALDKAVEERRATLEEFKPKNSTLTNSLRYLPVATDAFAAACHQKGVPELVVSDARALAEVAMSAYVARSAEARDRVDAAADIFDAANTGLPEELREDATLLARHARRIATDVVDVQPVIERISEPDVEEASMNLQRVYVDAFAERVAAARLWRGALFLWGLATAAMLLFLLRKLVDLYANLEKRVAERTAELADKNAVLAKKEQQLRTALTQLVEMESMVTSGMIAAETGAHIVSALEVGDVEAAKKAANRLISPPS